MSEPQPSAAVPPQQDAPTQTPEERSGRAGRFPIWRLVWAVATLAFLGYVAFGSVEARIWRFNRLYYEDRRILDVWRYAVTHLPELPADNAVTVVFVASLVILVASTVLGLWYLLSEAGLGASADGASSRTSDAPHA